MASPPHVALLIDTATTWGAGLIEGIVEFGRSGRQWAFFVEPRGKYDRMMLPEGWTGDGVIARITHQDLADQLIAAAIPAVNVSWYRFGENQIPRCTCDESAAAKLAADYLLTNGFRQFAYCGSSLRPKYHDRYGDAFVEAIAQAGYACTRFAPGESPQRTSADQLAALGAWLLGLPRPVAVLAFDDLQGRQITEACSRVGLIVPHDVAVLGGEHDELSSRISRPPLSGVDQSPQEVGYRAAELLEQMMLGSPPPTWTLLIPPKRIVARQSTDRIALPDDLLSEAIRFIRRNYEHPFSVSDILRAVPLSRRSLEKGFREHLGRSPRDEIRRVRVEKAVEMLCDTDWSVTKIAASCGFDRPELLTRAFRRELKTTPSEFRKRRGSSAPAKNGAT